MSSADLVIKNHQGIKAEIEARADRFSSCIDMGQGLLARGHYAAEEVCETWLYLAVPVLHVWPLTSLTCSSSLHRKTFQAVCPGCWSGSVTPHVSPIVASGNQKPIDPMKPALGPQKGP